MYSSKDDLYALNLLLQAFVCLICMMMRSILKGHHTGQAANRWVCQQYQVKYSPSLSLPQQQDAFTDIWAGRVVLYDGYLHSKLH